MILAYKTKLSLSYSNMHQVGYDLEDYRSKRISKGSILHNDVSYSINSFSPLVTSLPNSTLMHSVLSLMFRTKVNNEEYVNRGSITNICSEQNWFELFEDLFLPKNEAKREVNVSDSEIERREDSSKSDNEDDLIFYVKNFQFGNFQKCPLKEVDVYRIQSTHLPTPNCKLIDWEETVYLNLIMQKFDYYITCAICSRTGKNELQILKKITLKVFATPSRRKMGEKGTSELMTYPDIYFMIDDFEEVFSNMAIRDSEILCIELMACNQLNKDPSVLFLGSIKYEPLKECYDLRKGSHNLNAMLNRMTECFAVKKKRSGLHKRIEFINLGGPILRGRAELAIARVKGSGLETPLQTHRRETFPEEYFKQNIAQRRMSDPNMAANMATNYSTFFGSGSDVISNGYHGSGIDKNGWNMDGRRVHGNIASKMSKSENQSVELIGSPEILEIRAGDIKSELLDAAAEYPGYMSNSFGQSWYFYKEHRRNSSVALHTFLTYITLPWYNIVEDLLQTSTLPILSNSGV